VSGSGEGKGLAELDKAGGGVFASSSSTSSSSTSISSFSSSSSSLGEDKVDASDRSEGFLARGTVTRSLGGGGSRSEELEEEAVGAPLREGVVTGCFSVSVSPSPSLSSLPERSSSSSSSSFFPGVSGVSAAVDAEEARLDAELTVRGTAFEAKESCFGSGVFGGRAGGAAVAAAGAGGARAAGTADAAFSAPIFGGVASEGGVSDPVDLPEAAAFAVEGAAMSTATARLVWRLKEVERIG
jgi:hypothetical protein